MTNLTSWFSTASRKKSTLRIFAGWRLAFLLTALLLGGALPDAQAGTWTSLTHLAPNSSGGLMLLLTDGTVMCKSSTGGASYGNAWNKLTPDASGSYVNGTWTTLAPMIDTRLYFASQVLKDGRVFVAGGEYGTGNAKAEIYDPRANAWTAMPTPGTSISDADSLLMPDGRVLVAMVTGNLKTTTIFDTVANTYIAGPTCNGIHNESVWVQVPDGSTLFVDRLSTNSERYIPGLNQWVVDGTVPVQLYDPYGEETGPGFLLPNGKAFFIGSPNNTAYYTPSGTASPGVWTTGPAPPNASGAPDAPGAMMANGRILCLLSPTPTTSNHFPSPSTFYEFDYTTNTYTAINTPTGLASENNSTYIYNMLDLPDGSVMFAQQGLSQYYVYNPGGTPVATGKPVVNSISANGDGSYHLAGTGLNGISQGAAYGDDWQMNTNYPIVKLTSGTNVYYCRTYSWSSVGVQTGSTPVTTEFTLPASLPLGTYSLTVSANGISSDPFPFGVCSISPVAGIPGATVTITGTGFTGSTAVNFNGMSAAFAVNSDTQITATVPVGVTTGYVTVVTPSGTVSSTSVFTALTGDGTPTLASFTPSSGLPASSVTITGTNYAGVSSLVFNGVAAAFTVNSITQITATVPIPTPTTGTVGFITVTNGYGAATSSTTFTTVAELATYNSATDVPITANGYTATGTPVYFALNFAPTAGTNLTVINNTGLSFISGTFSNLAQGQAVALTFNGIVYNFVANYYGGAGNDLVLQWATNRPIAWGLDNYSQLGNNNPQNVVLPVGVINTGALAGKTVTAVAAGYYHTLALCSDGTLAAWGYNGNGQLGNGTTINGAVPLAVSTAGTALAGKTVVAIAVGDYHNLALCSDGTVASWGYNVDGELGNSSTTQSTVPVAVTTAGTPLAGKTITTVVAGAFHSLALCSDGTVAEWGSNTNGQLGNNSTTNSPVAVSVSTSGTALAGKTVTAVAGGLSYTLARCSDGTVCAWGLNSSGQLGNNSTTQSLVAVAVSTTGTALAGKTVAKIAASPGTHSLALCSDGTLISWGGNTNGQLGIGNTTNSLVPVAVTITGTALAGKTVTAICTGQDHSMALCSDGSIATWGFNANGQLGDGITTQSTVAVSVDTAGSPLAGKSVSAIVGGDFHGVALCTDGTVAGWGDNFDGQLGNGAMNAPLPVATTTAGTPLAGKTIVMESAGSAHTLALCSDGTLAAWGNNGNGQLGNGTTTQSLVPVAVTTTGALSGKTVIAVSAGVSHSLVLCSDGTMASWGLNANGQLGNNSTTQSTTPVLVTTTGTALAGKTVVAISAGGASAGAHNLALCSDGTVVAWGYNLYGQLGNNSTTQSTTAVAVTTTGVLSGKTVTNIAAGAYHSMVLCSDGTLVTWGQNVEGQLGNNSTTNSGLPVLVTTTGVLFGKTVTAICAGSSHNLALCSDGTVAAWGWNNNGQLGNNSVSNGLVPVAVNTSGVLSGKTVTRLSAGIWSSVAQCSDGTVTAWGYNGDGELGNNSTTQSLVPVTVSTSSLAPGEGFALVASGDDASHFLAIVDSPPAPQIGAQLASGTVLNSGGGSVNFGSSHVGTGVTLSFTIVNNGFAPLLISGVTIDGANAADFGVSTAPANTLAVGASTTMGVTFTPSATLSRSAAIHIASNDPATGSFTINVTGDGIGALAATYNSATDVALNAAGFTATGSTVSFTLNYAPTAGTNLTVIRNTGTNFIQGTFSNLAQGQKVSLTHSGITYTFVANYFGGTGKDLVLQWADVRAVAWGDNNDGQLGNNKSTQSSVPQAVVIAGTALAGKTVASVFSGQYHHLALCTDGTLVAWGYNGLGQLGNNSILSSSAPVAVTTAGTPLAGKTIVALSAGYAHNLALCSDGTLAAWGLNSNGQLGNNSTTESNVPVAVTTTGALSGKTVVAVAAGDAFSLVLCSDGTVAAWGNNGNGQLGNGSTTQSTVPVLVPTTGTALAAKTVVAISAGFSHSVAVCSDGSVATWGLNSNGQLGNNSTTQSTVPVGVTTTGTLSGKTVMSVAAGWYHNLAVCSDGTLAAWGLNGDGQLGNNSTTQSTVPVAVTTSGTPLSGKTALTVSAGAYHSLVRCTDGTLAAWGFNNDGQLGNNSTTNSVVPGAVSTTGALAGKTVAKITAGGYDNLVLNSDGSPVVWGYDDYGQLGDGVPVISSVPVPVTTTGTPLAGETITAFAAGEGHSLALCADGTVASWGLNNNGQLGDASSVGNGGTTSSSVPVAVATSGTLFGKTVVAVAAGYDHNLALCSDGTVAAWGLNSDGQLGNATAGTAQAPVAVYTGGVLFGKTVVAIAAGSYHSLALCSDGTLCSWGYNTNGQLGNNSTTNSNVPVAVITAGTPLAGKTIVAISAGADHSVALCSDGTLAAWGYNGFGGLGNNSTTQSTVPVAVVNTGVLFGRTVVAVKSGEYYNIVLCSDGTVATWGQNSDGQLGNNSTSQSTVPVLVNTTGVLSGKTVVAISSSGYNSLALCSDDTLTSWGFDADGELGNNATTLSSVPVVVSTAPLAAGERFAQGAGGEAAFHSLAIVAEPPFPVANTLAAAPVTVTTATLNASVNPDGNAATVNFQYGLTTSYGSTTQTQAAGSAGSFVGVAAALTGFSAHTTYHYRITATSAAGTANGADMTFTTLDTPPVAHADTASNVAGAMSIPVLANDTDADGDSLTITGATQGALGGVTTDGNTVTYTPGASFTTSDTFTYTISDGFGGTATGNVTVNAAPVQTWRAQTFGANSNNPAIAGDNADPNGNGIPNLMEYALHGDAVGSTTGASILPRYSSNPSTGALQLNFTRYQDRTDITLIVQACDSLTGPWTNLAQSVDGTPFTVITSGATLNESGNGNAISVTVGDLYQMTDPNHPQRFMRLQVTRP